jgi:hypothetical protein
MAVAAYFILGVIMDEPTRIRIATNVVEALQRQSGIDVVPAAAAMGRILTGVFRLTGCKFTQIGHGRHRDIFDIISPEGDPSLALKLGNKVSNAREVALSLKYPEDWAKIYAAFDYGVVAERVETVKQISDKRLQTPEFQARAEELNKRYIAIDYNDIGYVGDRMVLIGSSVRVINQDAVNPRSSTQQWRAE